MENTDSQFEIRITVEEDLLLLSAAGNYSLTKANHLFKKAIDEALLHNKTRVLIDVTNVTGSIPFFDRFKYAESLSQYILSQARGKINGIAVVGKEPIVDRERFGETVAVNRGVNVRVFTDMNEATDWLHNYKTT